MEEYNNLNLINRWKCTFIFLRLPYDPTDPNTAAQIAHHAKRDKLFSEVNPLLSELSIMVNRYAYGDHKLLDTILAQK